VALAVYSPLRLGAGHLSEALPSNPIHQAKTTALSLIPAHVSVSASNQLAAHLSERRRILIFPFAIGEARWIVLDEADPSYDRKWYGARIDRVRRDPNWRLRYAARGLPVHG
jgi:hypothetical protein